MQRGGSCNVIHRCAAGPPVLRALAGLGSLASLALDDRGHVLGGDAVPVVVHMDLLPGWQRPRRRAALYGFTSVPPGYLVAWPTRRNGRNSRRFPWSARSATRSTNAASF